MFAKNKKIIQLFLALSLGVLMAGCTVAMVMSSSWYQGYIQIDGYNEDWAGLWGFPEESPVAFAAKNHGETLFLAFRTNNAKVIRQAAFGGFAIIIDTKGGAKGRYGLRFEAQELQIGNLQNLTRAKLEPQINAHMMQLLNGQIAVKNSDGQGHIQPFNYRGAVMSSYDGDEWFIEASVPMAAMKQHPKYGGKIGLGFLTLLKYPSITDYNTSYAELTQNGLASGPWWVTIQLAKDPAGD